MNSKIINPSQYNKISNKTKEKRIKIIDKNIKQGTINKQKNSDIKDYSRSQKFIRIVFATILMILTSILSNVIFNIKDNAVINVFGNLDKEELNQNFEFKIACQYLDLNKNVIVNELKNYSYQSIIKFDKQYNIEYDLAQTIEKVDDLNYHIKFKNKDINEVVKNQIDEIQQMPENIYYEVLSNIENISVDDKYSMDITLYSPNDYFVFYLDFPIQNISKEIKINNLYNIEEDFENLNIRFSSVKNLGIINKFYISNYLSNINLIDDFKNNKIDMFLTSNEDDIKLLGRYDYNIKKYRDGENYFIFGNPDSNLFSKDEVRKAISYAIDKNQIANSASTSFAEPIDLPYIYSDVIQKYDVYAAENILIANSWSKQNGVYNKIENGERVELTIKLIVNEEDDIRCNIADSIKEMLEAVGIKVELLRLDEESINEAVENSDYDIILAKLYISKVPDISFIYPYISINENIKNKINNISMSDISNLTENVLKLQNAILSDVACIGIISKNSNVIIQKNIVGIEDISYMNIFENMPNIGIMSKK